MSTLTHPVLAGAIRDDSHVSVVRKLFAAISEAMTAMRAYERSRARGVPHADAITRAFDAGYNT